MPKKKGDKAPDNLSRLRYIDDKRHQNPPSKKLSEALHQSPAVVVITDPAGCIEYVNPAFSNHTGYSPDEVRGENPRIFQSGLTPKSYYENLWQTILTGRVWRGELQNRKKSGELFWERAIISPILSNEGQVTNFVAIKEDITDQKQRWDALISVQNVAEESDLLKSAFLCNIIHDIRTPMNGILWFSQLLKDPNLSEEEQAEYIDLIQQSGNRILSLVNNLINISRKEAGGMTIHLAATSVNELLRDLYAFFKPEINKRGLILNCITPLSEDESTIETDNEKLDEILTNLIQNALKFTKSGKIDFGYNLINCFLEFYVIDTGVGIPLDMKEKIFDRFHQVDNPWTRTQEGSGLGLSISKAYVELMGGNIWVESVEGKGSEFYFTLPYNPTGSRNIMSSSEIIKSQGIEEPALTILIAEDDSLSSFLLKKILSNENITTLFAGNGEEAVAMVRQHQEINLVLMDIRMPVMDGYDATTQIKKIRPELPVIIQTAFVSKEERQKAIESGGNYYIIKPINKCELLDMLHELLRY